LKLLAVTNLMNKLIRDGLVAVLYSPGYGAGWFTWNTSRPEILFDPALVELVEQEKWEELQAFVVLKYPDIYVGGLEDLQIEWMPEGTQFQVNEYDGSESIEKRDSVNWHTA
jgi:hypothetical protein